jgi:hypothetical protein
MSPPQANRIDGKFRRVMVDPHADPPFVVGEIVDAIGDRLPEGGIEKIMDADREGLPVGPPFAPAVLKIPTNSFFFVSTEIAGWLC